jgi:hypothetical protein
MTHRKVLAMAAEGQAKWKAIDMASNTTPASKWPKVTAYADIEPNNNSPSSTQSIYGATVRTEEEEAAHQDIDTIILDSDSDIQAAVESSKKESSESSDAELSKYL